MNKVFNCWRFWWLLEFRANVNTLSFRPPMQNFRAGLWPGVGKSFFDCSAGFAGGFFESVDRRWP